MEKELFPDDFFVWISLSLEYYSNFDNLGDQLLDVWIVLLVEEFLTKFYLADRSLVIAILN